MPVLEQPTRVRRAALSLTPTDRFTSWLASLGYVSRAAMDGLTRAPPVFLVPEEYAVVPGLFVEESWDELLTAELDSLGVAAEHRPDDRNLELFRRWFAVAPHREVHDLAPD